MGVEAFVAGHDRAAGDELTVTARELREDGPPALLATGLSHLKDGKGTVDLSVTLERAGAPVLLLARHPHLLRCRGERALNRHGTVVERGVERLVGAPQPGQRDARNLPLVGLLVLLNWYVVLNSWAISLTPEWLLKRL